MGHVHNGMSYLLLTVVYVGSCLDCCMLHVQGAGRVLLMTYDGMMVTDAGSLAYPESRT